MRRTAPVAALAALACCGGWAQPAPDSPTFEAASVKLSPPRKPGDIFFGRHSGGPGTPDPGRIDWRQMSIDVLVSRAYDVPQWQLFSPDWTRLGQYDITAKLPPGTTMEQFRLMLQNLLAERFKVRVHREMRELAGYSLTVANGGPKLRPHVTTAQTAAEDKPPESGFKLPAVGPDGYPVLTARIPMAAVDGKSRKRWDNAGIGEVAETLSAYLRAPVTDDTALTGKYDLEIYWQSRDFPAKPDDDPGPDLVAAVQQQLGLKMEKLKRPFEVLVLDSAEKIPTGD